jgi:hypothetical protein
MKVVDSIHQLAAGTPARLLASVFGSLLAYESGIPPVVKDFAFVILQSLVK